MELATRTIVESRLKACGFLAMSVGFVALGAWLALHPDHPSDALWGWFGVAFFGFGGLIFVWQLVRPMRLTLDANGFVLAGGLRRAPKRFAWADIDQFFIFAGPRGTKGIGFKYRPGRAPRGVTTKIARALSGADAGLPTGWTLSPDKVVDVLNEYRARYGLAAAAPPQPQIVS